jgi:hypothetical protein
MTQCNNFSTIVPCCSTTIMQSHVCCLLNISNVRTPFQSDLFLFCAFEFDFNGTYADSRSLYQRILRTTNTVLCFVKCSLYRARYLPCMRGTRDNAFFHSRIICVVACFHTFSDLSSSCSSLAFISAACATLVGRGRAPLSPSLLDRVVL